MPEPLLHVLPTQVIEIDNGVLLIRGATQFRLIGAGSYDLVYELFTRLHLPGQSRSDLLAAFAGPERDKLEQLVDLLIARRLVSSCADAAAPASEQAAEEIFFWDFGLRAADVRADFAKHIVHIAGLNRIGLAIAGALRKCGFVNLTLIDIPVLRNVALFDQSGRPRTDLTGDGVPEVVDETSWRDRGRTPSLLVATSDFGGKALLRPWNEWAVGAGVPFFAVVLQNLVGSIGPYVVPYETPCYECVRGRENSNMDDPSTQREMEALAFEGQFATGYHPLMPDLVAGHAAFELTKMYSGMARGPIGRLITVSPLDSGMSTHRVLKLPYCPVCGTNARHARPAIGDIEG